MTEAGYEILPGAALNDPALRERIEQKIRKKGYGERSRELLARHPWREFGYKRGKWARTNGMLDQWWDYKSWQRDYSHVQLLDPASGVALAVLLSPGFVKRSAVQGRIWVAGDPCGAAVLTPVGDGVKQVELTAALPSPTPYREEFPHGGSLWLADCPRKPRRSRGFVWDGKAERRNWSEDKAEAERVEAETQRAVAELLKPGSPTGHRPPERL